MTLTYLNAGFNPGTSHQNVRKAWDTLLHEQVLNKSAFKGLTGTDKGGEGDLDMEVANKPIVLKTQLGKESGDQITMGLVASNVKQGWIDGAAGNNWYNLGVTGNTQLVDAEGTLTLYNVKVKIGHVRFGVQIDGKLTLQKTPYDLLRVAKDRVAEQMIYVLDNNIFHALYSGFSSNVHRELGTTAVAGVAHPNRIFGRGQSAITGISSTDELDTNMLEIVRVFFETANINPVIVDGDPYGLLFVHPTNGKTLRADSHWVDANAFAQPRGNDNAIFQNKLGMWGGLVIKESNKISTGIKFESISASADVLTQTAETFSGGTPAANVYMCTLLGANAIARAFALESYMVRRKEDDYENIYGFGGGCIYGDRRADFALSDNTGVDGAVKNQSSAIVYAFAPTVTVPTVWG